jgi:hypothetical protein
MLLKTIGKASRILPDLSKMLQGYTILLHHEFRNSKAIIVSWFADYDSTSTQVPYTITVKIWNYLEHVYFDNNQTAPLSNFLNNLKLSGDLYYPREWSYRDITDSWLTALCKNGTKRWDHQPFGYSTSYVSILQLG